MRVTVSLERLGRIMVAPCTSAVMDETMQSVAVAVEGPCCAGKTTLCANLATRLSGMRIAVVEDYAAFVGGGRHLPPPVPGSLAEERTAIQELLQIEERRFRPVRHGHDKLDLVLIDRSAYTLLAHAYALGSVTEEGYFELVRSEVNRSTAPYWPDCIIYLDISPEIVLARNRGKFATDSIFIDKQFNAGIRDYFEVITEAGSPPISWLDAECEPDSLCNQAVSLIRDLRRRPAPQSRMT